MKFYNHAGEYVVKKKEIKGFEWENNVQFKNVKIVIEKAEGMVGRIGHGIVYL